MSDRTYQLVVYGATSFVGQILCRRLVERVGIGGDVRWAIAGRNRDKLDQVARETGADVDRIIADAADPSALRSMTDATDVVASTVGPYALHGSPLIAAAVAAGTDYCDLTGEPQWMRAMIDAHQADAVASGARIVHACGFDSIPSDLGVWFTQREAQRRFGQPCSQIGYRLKAAKGGFSGGTAASLMNVVDEARRDRELRSVLADPYALAPASLRSGPKQPNVTTPRRDALSGQWVAPFVMAATNTKVVQRSHALLGRPWGDDFEYDEATLTGRGVKGAAMSSLVAGGLAGFTLATAFGPTRRLAGRMLPDPGEGPSADAQASGYFDIRFHGRTRSGRTITTKVTGDRDPGYGSTAKMLTEAALAFGDVARSSVPGGFWTPATMFGDLLIERLVAHAGLTFEVTSTV